MKLRKNYNLTFSFLPSTVQIDVLFLINQVVNLIFAFDMFVQARSPYRDAKTGKLVTDSNRILFSYLFGWGPVDLLSVIPFELIALSGSISSQLQILRVLRLMKLAKLLRLFRASRKLKKLQVYVTLRYSQIQLLKVNSFKIYFKDCYFCSFSNSLVCLRFSYCGRKGISY